MYAEEIAERLREFEELGFERWPHWWKKAESVAGAWQERFRVRVVKRFILPPLPPLPPPLLPPLPLPPPLPPPLLPLPLPPPRPLRVRLRRPPPRPRGSPGRRASCPVALRTTLAAWCEISLSSRRASLSSPF